VITEVIQQSYFLRNKLPVEIILQLDLTWDY